MILRPFSISDKDALIKAKDCGFSDGWNADMIDSAIKSGNFYGIVADDGVIKGFITYTLTVDFAEVADLFVFPEYRGTGIGEKLLSELIVSVKSSGRQKVFLEVRKGNFPAKTLYEKLGFKTLYERKKYYGDEDATVMVKEL